ncbi:hypothetical protein Lal_00019624 [Lupinus albus]|nr:hypothetical protein Lal_00019624 [Lupinus albus]
MRVALPAVEIDKARRHLRLLTANRNCAHIMLRLPSMYLIHHFIPISFILQSIKQFKLVFLVLVRNQEVKGKHPRITYADLYQLACVVVVENLVSSCYFISCGVKKYLPKKGDFLMPNKVNILLEL